MPTREGERESTNRASANSEALRQLWVKARHLLTPGKRLVPGEGSPLAELMIVGEAPGAEEARQGRPFIGRAGQLLNQMLEEVSLPREQIWVTNVVKWRPTAIKSDRLVNRPPTARELRVGEEVLREEMEIIQPKVILCLGNYAARSVIDTNFKMNEDHGQWFVGPEDSKVMGTFHPAYVLRQRGPERERLMGLYRQDFQAVATALRERA